MAAKAGKYLDRAQQAQLVEATHQVNMALSALAQSAIKEVKGILESTDPFDESVHKAAAEEAGKEVIAVASTVDEQSGNMNRVLGQVAEQWKITLDTNVKSTRNAVEDLRRATQTAKEIKK